MNHHPFLFARLRRLLGHRARAASGLLSALCLAACGGAPPSPSEPPAPGAEMPVPDSPEVAASYVLTWAMGTRRAPPPLGPAEVLWLEAAQPLSRARKVSVCRSKDDTSKHDAFGSMMPIPDENIVLVTINGAIHTVPANGNLALYQPATFDPDLYVDFLLARVRGSNPTSVLALVTNTQTGRVSFWTLRVDAGRAVGQEVASLGAFVSLARFLDAYDSPRCKTPGKECVVVDSDGEVLFERERGQLPRAEVKSMSGAGVRDVVWDGDGQWVLRACTP